MNEKILLPIRMSLFDGEGGAATAAAAPAEAGSGNAPAAAETGSEKTGETNATRGNTRRGKETGESAPRVLYGRQTPTEEAPKAQEVQQTDAAAAKGEEDLHSQFLEMVNGKFKDEYTKATQAIIDRRFREAKETEQRANAQQPIIDLLMQQHGITDGDMGKLMDAVSANDPTIEQRAEDNGLSVEQQRQMDKLERENKLLREAEESRVRSTRAQETVNGWMREAAEIVGTRENPGIYPQFDLAVETQNPAFVNMLRAGIPMRHAYEALHMDEIKSAVQQSAARSTEKLVADNIRAQGMRPAENGTSSQGGFTVKADPSKLTKADHAEIRRQVRAGAKIIF